MQKRFLALALPALICTQAASAQQLRPSLRDSLQKVSELLYEKGSSDFITVDAVKDGILKFNEPYGYVYQNHQLTFSKIKVSADQSLQYAQKLQACLKKHGKSDNGSITVSSEGITMKDIFDTTSSWWTVKRPLPARSDSAARLGDLLLLKMLEDKLVKDNEHIEIIYKPGFISLNGTQLKDPYAKKYIAMIEEVSKQSNSKPSYMRMAIPVETDKLRYPQPGPEIKDK